MSDIDRTALKRACNALEDTILRILVNEHVQTGYHREEAAHLGTLTQKIKSLLNGNEDSLVECRDILNALENSLRNNIEMYHDETSRKLALEELKSVQSLLPKPTAKH